MVGGESKRRDIENSLRDAERQLADPKTPAMARLYMRDAAVNAACILGDAAKAREHYDHVTDPNSRKGLRAWCAGGGVKLPP
jgi:hypothetical protein